MIKTSDLIWQDTQHQLLFKLIDDIRQVPFDRSVLTQLQVYAEQHFSLEETYMKMLDYPYMDAHIEAHNRFREELNAMVETQANMNQALQDSLSMFLSEWLKLHVLGIDKKLEQFIISTGRQ